MDGLNQMEMSEESELKDRLIETMQSEQRESRVQKQSPQ